MKKIIIIASDIIAILFAIFLIPLKFHINTPFQPSQPINIVDIIGYSLMLGIPLISLLVIFNIKLPKALRIPFAVVSILIVFIYMTILGILLGDTSLSRSLYILCSILIIFYLPAIITLLTYIRRSLKPDQK